MDDDFKIGDMVMLNYGEICQGDDIDDDIIDWVENNRNKIHIISEIDENSHYRYELKGTDIYFSNNELIRYSLNRRIS